MNHNPKTLEEAQKIVKPTEVILVAIYNGKEAYRIVDRDTLKQTYGAAFACNHLYNSIMEER